MATDYYTGEHRSGSRIVGFQTSVLLKKVTAPSSSAGQESEHSPELGPPFFWTGSPISCMAQATEKFLLQVPLPHESSCADGWTVPSTQGNANRLQGWWCPWMGVVFAWGKWFKGIQEDNKLRSLKRASRSPFRISWLHSNCNKDNYSTDHLSPVLGGDFSERHHLLPTVTLLLGSFRGVQKGGSLTTLSSPKSPSIYNNFALMLFQISSMSTGSCSILAKGRVVYAHSVSMWDILCA